MRPSTVAERGRALSIASIGILAVAAWLALWLSHGAGHGLLLHHGGHAAAPSAMAAMMFVGGWTVMTVAMMLPTSLPVVVVFQAMVENRADRGWLITLVVLGYLVAWSAFGAIAYLVVLASQWIVSIVPGLHERVWAAGSGVLVMAGAFQFTSLKDRCLDRCRSPFAFVLAHWTGRRPARDALALGLDNGRYCIGCCWALMLLMLAVGAGSLVWMLALAIVMAFEKNASWGRRVVKPVGAALIVWGVARLAMGQ